MSHSNVINFLEVCQIDEPSTLQKNKEAGSTMLAQKGKAEVVLIWEVCIISDVQQILLRPIKCFVNAEDIKTA